MACQFMHNGCNVVARRHCFRDLAGYRGSVPRHGAVREIVQCRASAQVVVTREKGKNGKLMEALSAHGFECVEMPLIEHAHGPDRARLPAELATGGMDWVAITSPEAASVFLDGWRAAGSPAVRIAAVGGGTAEVLEAAGMSPEFTPSKATGKVLGAELPHIPGGSDVVLYPASVRASTDLQDSLAASGFSVRRLHTYDTVKVSAVEPAVLQAARAAPIVTFGSPSSVKAWLELVGLEEAERHLSICIGSTSARACESAGLSKNVYYPESPGIQGWVDTLLHAAEKHRIRRNADGAATPAG